MERTDSLSFVLRRLDQERASALLAYALYGANRADLARGLGIDKWVAQFTSQTALWQARLSKNHTNAWEFWAGDDGNSLVVDEELRALIREWNIEERFAPHCRQCRVVFERPKSARRPREYCSNACRQKAYRARLKTARSGDGDRV
ncbi:MULTISPECIES: hypothetical protein [Streptomyces]|uniref:CGNR zinc finger domain-containing protein n=1 Tax=Streptomyces dengpaensis TaxID=2049881 RepID=A0ABN5HU66_9ACTN|nr:MULTISPECIES: hypothetical protein [Streptomyces]AVH54624.1 hypothetical protein C4B68_00905 [Streptomyces dengpaensis]PIA98556.1 hypothetical protein B1C81_39520 [Streptomyces sp. HG99]